MNYTKVKKNNIILILIVCIIAFILLIMYLNKSEYVEKFSSIKIKDSYNNEIKEYTNNKMPFTISKTGDNVKIFVNGIKYEEGTRFYKTGKYKIVVDNGKEREKSYVYIKSIDKKAESEYNIYVTSGTLSTLFANLDMANKEKSKGFFWTQRTGMIDVEQFSDNLPEFEISKNLGITEESEIKISLISEIKDYIRNVLKNDENAYFHLYVEEYRFYLELELFGKIGLSDERYDVTIYSDGTLSYVREYEIMNKNEYQDFLKQKKEYEEIVNTMRDNTLEYYSIPGIYLKKEDGEYNYNYLLISTLRDNVKYILQYPEMIIFEDESIAQTMKDANFKKIVVQEEFNKLSKENQEKFFKNINLNKEQLDTEFFTDLDAKYLVITGTKPFYGTLTQEKFENLINKVYKDYSDEYTILYKPHPTALPEDSQKNFLEDLNIKILPGTIPMEAIAFIYPNLKVGGFVSSLYMSVDNGKTEFFFAENKNELIEPLNELYDKLFSDVKFLI